MSEDTIAVIEQGSPEAQKIAKAMSSPASASLYNKLADAPATASSLAESTGLPLTTVKYHLENLLDAGVIEVVNQRWSEKGRVMKIYGVFAPPQSKTAGAILKKYGVIAGGAAVGCSFAALIPKVILERGLTAGPAPHVYAAGVSERLFADSNTAGSEFAFMTTNAGSGSSSALTDAALLVIQNCVLAVFICALAVIAGLMIFELVRNRRAKSVRAQST